MIFIESEILRAHAVDFDFGNGGKRPFWLVENQLKMDIQGIQLEERRVPNMLLL